MSIAPKRNQHFRVDHELEYGLKDARKRWARRETAYRQKDIVDVIIFDLRFDPENGEESLEHARCIFTRPAGIQERDCYTVHINQTKLFNLVIEYTSAWERLSIWFLDRLPLPQNSLVLATWPEATRRKWFPSFEFLL